MRRSKLLRNLFHATGFGCVISAIYLQAWVLFEIITKGCFRFIEPNNVILFFEVFIPIFGLIYFVYVTFFLLKLRKGEKDG